MQKAPKLSEDHADVWKAYVSLKEYTYSEIESYMRVTGFILHQWEIEAIMTLSKYRDQEPIWPLNTQH